MQNQYLGYTFGDQPQVSSINNYEAPKPTISYAPSYSKEPYIILSDLEAVSTTQSILYQEQLLRNFRIIEISILPSSSASADGVEFALYFGKYKIGSINDMKGLATIINIDMALLQPKLNAGDTITLYGQATTSGSYVQLAITGYYDDD